MTKSPFQHVVADAHTLAFKSGIPTDAQLDIIHEAVLDEKFTPPQAADTLKAAVIEAYRNAYKPVPNLDLRLARIQDEDVWKSMRDLAKVFIEEHGTIPLPFPTCWFVVDDSVAVHATNETIPGRTLITLYIPARLKSGKTFFSPFYFCFTVQGKDIGLGALVCRPPAPSTDYTEMRDTAHTLLHDSLARIMMMMSPGTVVEKEPAPLKLNKARVKNPCKTIISDKYTVKLYDQVTRGSLPKNGTHASPRAHWRRGHFRTLSDGRKIPVVACIVGAQSEEVPELGKRMYEYIKKSVDTKRELP